MTAYPASSAQPAPQPLTGGYIFIHSAPVVLTPHIRWALENIMKAPVNLTWYQQEAKHPTQRAELAWAGPVGTAAIMASALRKFDGTFFEITEHATASTDALRFMHTPSLGICSLSTDANGNFTVTEDSIRYAFEEAAGSFDELLQRFSVLLGQRWDEELEPLRQGSGHNNIARITRKL